MADQSRYDINLDVKFPHLTTFDVQKLADDCTQDWLNQTLCHVNDSVLRLGIIEGEFHWHVHDEDDELFYVIDGELLIDL